MIEKITNGVWKVKADSNCYYIEEINTVIDTGRRQNKEMVKQFLSKVVPLEAIDIVIFTHMHYDHIGNFDLFPNAKYYASKEAIELIKNEKLNAILKNDIANMFNVELHNIKELDLPEHYEIIYTPGHTKGGICIWNDRDKILYSGDTAFRDCLGRTDLPTSNPKDMEESVIKLTKYNFKILCAGHDY